MSAVDRETAGQMSARLPASAQRQGLVLPAVLQACRKVSRRLARLYRKRGAVDLVQVRALARSGGRGSATDDPIVQRISALHGLPWVRGAFGPLPRRASPLEYRLVFHESVP